MSTPAHDQSTPEDGHPRPTPEGTPTKQHGDPLLAAAQGHADGDEGTRHGHDANRGTTPD